MINKVKLSAWFILLTLTLLVMTAGCSSGAATPAGSSPTGTSPAKTSISTPSGPAILSSISADPGSTEMSNKGRPLQLEITAIYSNSTRQTVTDKCTFKSSDEKVVTVSASGLVTPVSAGSCTIEVSYSEGGVTQTKSIPAKVFSGYISPLN